MKPVAWHEPGSFGNVTIHEKWALENGWLPLYTAPVRTKDLTDDEIDRALDAASVPELPAGYESVELDFARAVIAADREKNK